MSNFLGVENFADWNPTPDIIIGLHPTKQITDITIAEGQGKLKRGTMLAEKSSDNKYYIWDETKNDGTEKIVGILGCDVDTTDGDAKGFLYVSGEFNKVALFAGVTSVDTGSFNFGSIVIKEEKE